MRRDALSLADIQKKVLAMQRGLGATMMTATSGVFMPILMCELGAKKRGINLEVAAADAKYWWETGLAPLRPTPLAGQSSSTGTPNEKPKHGCFIATACYGSPDCVEVLRFRRFRDEVLLSNAFGRPLVHLYYRMSPPLAAVLCRKPILRSLVRQCVLVPVLKAIGHKQ
jgi:hypothetical protein